MSARCPKCDWYLTMDNEGGFECLVCVNNDLCAKLNAKEARITLAEKVIEAAKETRNHHWRTYDCGKAVQCPLCAALQEYYSVGFILYGPGGD